MRSSTLYCYECKNDGTKVKTMICGETAYGFVSTFVPNIWLKNRSVHSTRRWMFGKLLEYMNYSDASAITDDFIEVVGCMNKYRLVKGRNIPRYACYIIRLASRRGIELRKKINDLKDGPLKEEYDDRLFGKVYKELGWDVGDADEHYDNWKESQ